MPEESNSVQAFLLTMALEEDSGIRIEIDLYDSFLIKIENISKTA